jgi:hypothetical protein
MGTFKQQMMNDLQDTFLNTEDFGIQVTLVRDGVSYPMKALYDEPSLDGAAIGAEVTAISHRPRLIVSSADLPGGIPRKGDKFIVPESPLNPHSGEFVARDFIDEKDGSVTYDLQVK